MPSLDTNVLVRWLVDDDAVQTARVHKLLNSVESEHGSLFVPCTVTLELEWVLRSRYHFDKATLLQVFNALLETQELLLEAEAAVEWALHLYRQGSAEFADCLHAGLSAASGHAPLLTFDQKAAKLPGIELLADRYA